MKQLYRHEGNDPIAVCNFRKLGLITLNHIILKEVSRVYTNEINEDFISKPSVDLRPYFISIFQNISPT